MVHVSSSQCLRGMGTENSKEKAEVYVNVLGSKHRGKDVPCYRACKEGLRGMGFGFEEILERTKRLFSYKGEAGDGEIALGLLMKGRVCR